MGTAYLSDPRALVCPSGSHNANLKWWGFTPPSMPIHGQEAQNSYAYYGVQLWSIYSGKCVDISHFYSRHLVKPNLWPVFVEGAQPIIQDTLDIKSPDANPYQYFTG